jgi:hypothetical protein
MGERPPRFHRRPKDPGDGDGLDASAASTLAIDKREVKKKTQQRKNEISSLEQQQQQQWHGPNRTDNSSSTGDDDWLGASAAPALVIDTKEGSKTTPPRTSYEHLTSEQLRQLVREHQRQVCGLDKSNNNYHADYSGQFDNHDEDYYDNYYDNYYDHYNDHDYDDDDDDDESQSRERITRHHLTMWH